MSALAGKVERAPRGGGLALANARLPALQIDVILAETDHFVGARALVQDQASEVVQILVLRSTAEILPLLLGSEDVNANGIRVRWYGHIAHRVFPRPALLHGVVEELREGV